MLAAETQARQGNEVARVETVEGKVELVRAGLDGKIASAAVQAKAAVKAGDTILTLHPNTLHVLQALLALGAVGLPGDLPVVESFTKPQCGERVVTEASKAAKAIRAREQGQSARHR